ncbi:MAG: bifunctional diaminohydroxyphosphoribosylaminopyrimidine deaminase/5-amino-6-(5-phosphoribosylamino)uracil reductase RibD [Boseongicola sp.]
MSDFRPADYEYMAHALRLAGRGKYTTQPNPCVGCVLVRNDEIVGRGWHQKAGQAHAEIDALEDAGEAARDAIAYVTLEPCSHHGKTPPCSSALADAGVAKVIAAVADPNPDVDGKGFASLRAAGVATEFGLMQKSARALNRGFFSRFETGRPFVTLKIAASLDGRTAMKSGESRWITSPESRADVQKLRAASGAIMTGVATVMADDPSLTVRDQDIKNEGRQPLRVVLDSRLRMAADARLLNEPGQTQVFCCDDSRRGDLEQAGAQVSLIAEEGNRIDVARVLRELGSDGINDMLVEAGPVLAGSLLDRGLADEIVIYQAPHIMGSETRGMFSTPAWEGLAERRELTIVDVRKIGADLKITATPGQ